AFGSGFKAGFKAALSAEAVAAEIPMVVLAIADKVAAREAARNISIKFLKEGFAKGVAAAVMAWSEDDVASELLNHVTEFRLHGLEDPGGFLSRSFIFNLAQTKENYAVVVGYEWAFMQSTEWKENVRKIGLSALNRYGYHWDNDSELLEYDFIDKLAWTIS